MLLKKIPLYGWAGAIIIICMQAAILLKAQQITVWATPVLWTGLILLLDAILFTKTGTSIVRNGKIFSLAILSIISWWIFEWFNIFLSNWHYINLVNPIEIRYLGYFWAFGTIFPGVLLTHALLKKALPPFQWKPFNISKKSLTAMFITGLFFLFIPVIPFSMNHVTRAADPELFFWISWCSNPALSEYTACFVWTAVVLILEPLNYSLGNKSLLRSCEKGNYRDILSLSMAGLICGFLWEFWNYSAATKWIYTVPILSHIKIFEMPVPGYAGFVAFAWEIYAITSLILPKTIDTLEIASVGNNV